MASNYTSNYNLCQWAASDKVLRSEFNADNAKIDSAIKAVDRRVSAVDAGKADTSALSALSQTVAGGLALRNCRVVTGSYKGTGEYGPSHPNVLTFPQKPVFVCVTASGTAAFMLLVREQRAAVGAWATNPPYLNVNWTDRSVSWNVLDSVASSVGPGYQLNNGTYFYMALLEVE